MYPADVSENWKKWTRVGIAEQVPAQGGSRGSLFSLEEFGIEVPKNKTDKIADAKKTSKPGVPASQSQPNSTENQT